MRGYLYYLTLVPACGVGVVPRVRVVAPRVEIVAVAELGLLRRVGVSPRAGTQSLGTWEDGARGSVRRLCNRRQKRSSRLVPTFRPYTVPYGVYRPDTYVNMSPQYWTIVCKPVVQYSKIIPCGHCYLHIFHSVVFSGSSLS